MFKEYRRISKLKISAMQYVGKSDLPDCLLKSGIVEGDYIIQGSVENDFILCKKDDFKQLYVEIKDKKNGDK